MWHRTFVWVSFLFAVGCGIKSHNSSTPLSDSETTKADSKVLVAFGSCNKYDKENRFWDDILELEPDVFIWGGDNIYADTDSIPKMRNMYDAQKAVADYARLRSSTYITGTWDDHDYGLNDGGMEFRAKKESQQAFLDFMDVPADSPRRKQEGVYTSYEIKKPNGSVKLLLLDTRYFRSALIKSSQEGVRYEKSTDLQPTILGEVQWTWLEEELRNSKADFNIIVTSIQFLSSEHGFEKWANFTHEVEKMKRVLLASGAKRVIFLSGDRHISEFSRMKMNKISYPIIDFTSSGLTHSYSNFTEEPNSYRVGEVVSTTSFGVLDIDLEQQRVTFKMMGENGKVLGSLDQSY